MAPNIKVFLILVLFTALFLYLQFPSKKKDFGAYLNDSNRLRNSIDPSS